MDPSIREYAEKQSSLCKESDVISEDLFTQYGVNRGLRDVNGNGVLTGLTNISRITAFKNIDGERTPVDGELWYRGYKINSLVNDVKPGEFGFEKTAYLLIFGEKPTKDQLEEFTKVLSLSRRLPTNFTRDVIMKAPSRDIMNSMTRSILTLASYDHDVSTLTVENCLRQCIQLIAEFPMLACYGYHAYNHYENDESMYIHRPDPKLSSAENFLRMVRPDNKFTELEARVLDIAMMIHMEHGGGNNSTFTTRVVTSAGTDTYSAIAAAMSSLKGSKHGGANIKVMEMMDDIRLHVKDINDRDEVGDYVAKILNKDAFDHQGLVYGLGHAIYSLSDPRERIFHGFVGELAKAKGRERDMEFYEIVKEEAIRIICEKRRIYKGVCANVDFYSGFVYDMLDIPAELYTPLFAIARIVGWSAHRIEELIGMNKIIRPAYMSVMQEKE